MAKSDLKFTTTEDLVNVALGLPYFHEDEGVPAAIPFRWVPGQGRLVVVTGENAGGKSFFRRILSAIAQSNKIESISISMEGRRKVSYNPGLVFVYGDEEHDATGILSIRTVTTGISTSKGRETDHLVIWDEPDIGLSEGNAASVGKAISDFALEDLPKNRGSFVITHRKALVKELLPANPHYLYLGSESAPDSLQAWVEAPPVVRPLKDVLADAHARFLSIHRVLNS